MEKDKGNDEHKEKDTACSGPNGDKKGLFGVTGAAGKKCVISSGELEDLRKRAAEREEYYDKWIKVLADYDNTRKRMERERINHLKFANEDIIARLFPIVDNFDMALSAMDKAEDKVAVMEGIRLVQKEFHKILDENGVEKIKTVGESFDPNVHEAVFAIDTDEYPDGTVTEEVRAGYIFNGRLLRPAQVKVARGEAEVRGS